MLIDAGLTKSNEIVNGRACDRSCSLYYKRNVVWIASDMNDQTFHFGGNSGSRVAALVYICRAIKFYDV